MSDNSKEILNKVDAVLEEEGLATNATDKSPMNLLEKFIVPGLYASKNTLGNLYKYVPKEKFGFLGKVKNRVIGRIKNIVLNVVERESMSQQKFNELTYQAVLNLTEEVKKLREQIGNKN